MSNTTKPWPIRSFVRREGRLTRGQRHALETLLPIYGVPDDIPILSWRESIGTDAPVVLEIGFGNGRTLAETAAKHPKTAFLGIEVHRPGVGQLLMRIEELKLKNVRVICADAVPVLATRIPDRSLTRVHVFFPDPWPKKRHFKRRLVQSDWIDLVADKLAPCGTLHLATDWQDYAEQMTRLLGQTPRFRPCSQAQCAAARKAYRSPTKFEARGRKLGHEVWDLVFRRSG
jgi:tRNA (guanine-N7-)-methyltransferase